MRTWVLRCACGCVYICNTPIYTFHLLQHFCPRSLNFFSDATERRPCPCHGNYSTVCDDCWTGVDVAAIRAQIAALGVTERGTWLRNSLDKAIFFDPLKSKFAYVLRVGDYRVCLRTFMEIYRVKV